MQLRNPFLPLLALGLFLNACNQSSSPTPEAVVPMAPVTLGSFTDSRDGHVYATTTIGNQTWMAENLQYVPANGLSWCYSGLDNYCATYGRLYQGIAALHACPQGWHLPAMDEWDTLFAAVGNREFTYRLKSTTLWDDTTSGTNESGFNALPSGYLSYDEGYESIGERTIWWTASSTTVAEGGGVYVLATDSAEAMQNVFLMGNYYNVFGSSPDSETTGYAVRCVQ